MRTSILLPFAAALSLSLSACGQDITGRGAVADGPLAAPGVARGADVVDPLIVGDRLLAAGEAELALDSYIRAAAGPRGATSDVRVAMAQANISLGRLGQAERMLREVVAEEPRNAPALNNLGVTLLELGEFGEAHLMFKSAFALQPSPEILGNLRVSAARLEGDVYTEPQDEPFTLTRRNNGVYDLNSPDGLFP